MQPKDQPISDDTLKNWQQVLDLIVRIAGVRAGLIMHIVGDYLEVLAASKTGNHPYKIGDKDYLPSSGLYCETVINKQKMLVVPNALNSDQWNHNPDLKNNMVAYLGFPVRLANGQPFGTICILDDKENAFSPDLVELMEKMRDLIENNLWLEEKFWNQQCLVSGSFLRRVLDHIPTAVCLSTITPEYRIIYLNKYFEYIFGYTITDISSLAHWITEESSCGYYENTNLTAWQSMLTEVQHETGRTEPREFRLLCKDGSTCYVLVSAVVLEGMLLTSLVNVTAIKNSEENLRISEKRYRLLAENAADVIWTLNLAEERITYVNPSIEKLKGYTPNEYRQLPMEKMFTAESWNRLQKILAKSRKNMRAGRPVQFCGEEIEGQRKDNTTVWTEITGSGIYGSDGHLVELVGVSRDITARKSKEKKMVYRATHDELTGLPNLRRANEYLSGALKMAQRSRKPVAVMFVDLDGFKEINDQYGHVIGNFVLKHVAEVIKLSLCKKDMVARLGGDEFLIVATAVPSKENVATIAQRVIQLVSQPIWIYNRQIIVNASIGIALYPERGRDPKELIEFADAAMYEVKKSGKNGYGFA